jgi:hypothetical protein
VVAGVDINALLNACPICPARLLLAVVWVEGPIVMSKSCVQVRPAATSAAVPLLNVTGRSFHTGLMFPLVTTTNLISILTESGVYLFGEADGSSDGNNWFVNIASCSHRSIPRSLSRRNEAEEVAPRSLKNGSFLSIQIDSSVCFCLRKEIV